MSSSGHVNRMNSAHDLSVERLENTGIGFMIFSFLDAVVTQLLQKLVKGLASLIYLKTYRCMVLQHIPLCSAKWDWTTGLAHVLPRLQMFTKPCYKNTQQHFWNYLGDSCFRQVSPTRLGARPTAHDILNALVRVQAMKTQSFFNPYGSTSELEGHKPERNEAASGRAGRQPRFHLPIHRDCTPRESHSPPLNEVTWYLSGLFKEPL